MLDQPRWNYEPCEARVVRVIVGPTEVATWWCSGLEGTEREAVEVKYDGQVFYLDNDAFPGADRELFAIAGHEAGTGWAKVMNGGGPDMPHSSLPVAKVLEPQRQYDAQAGSSAYRCFHCDAVVAAGEEHRHYQRQYVAVKFSSSEERAYTYHNDGPPVGAGQEVKLPARVRKGELPDPEAWTRGIVVEIGVPKPEGFETKGILGLAPLKPSEEILSQAPTSEAPALSPNKDLA